MERDSSTESNDYERLDADLSAKDPADAREGKDDTDVNRRDTLTHLMNVAPETAPLKDTEGAIYGETDMDANAQDQRDVHNATPDDIV